MEGDGWDYFMLVIEKAPLGSGPGVLGQRKSWSSQACDENKKKRALVLQLSGLPGTPGSRAEMPLRGKWH